MRPVILLIALGAVLLLLQNPPDPERLERWALDLPDFFPRALTPEQVVRYTNEFRSSHGLPPVTINTQLSAAAEARALDMKRHQYFAHENPLTGKGPSEAIAEAGYVARLSAENIAKGTWRSNQALVQAWIDSPGHRANILKPEVREIGVGLMRDGGILSGRPLPAYYAVQLFGKPLSDCGDPPSERDRAAIQDVDARLRLLNERISELRRELDASESRIAQATGNPERNRLVQGHNRRVAEFNQMLAEARGVQETLSVMVDTYNAKSADFNTCGERG
jgi:hypothetical protein